MTDQFDWDPDKARLNQAKHGVSFEEAAEAFADVDGFDLVDSRADYGEERFIRIARSSRRCLTVVFVEREDTVRIISARPSSRQERQSYVIAADPEP